MSGVQLKENEFMVILNKIRNDDQLYSSEPSPS